MSSSHNIFKLICLPKLERPSIIPSIDLKKTELDNIFEIRSYAERRLLKFNESYIYINQQYLNDIPTSKGILLNTAETTPHIANFKSYYYTLIFWLAKYWTPNITLYIRLENESKLVIVEKLIEF